MPPEYDINSSYEAALSWVEDALRECDGKFATDTRSDKITNKLSNIVFAIERYKSKIEMGINEDYQNNMLFIIYNLGLLTGIISFYLQNENITKEQMIELNNIYRKYKNEKK